MTINVWAAYIVSGAFVLLLGALAVVLVINADLRASIAAGDAARSLLQSQNSAWAQRTAATNKAFARIKAADEANAKAIASAEIAATAAEKKLKEKAAAIAGFKLTGKDCDGVLALREFYFGHLP